MACITCEISEPTYISSKDKIFKKIKNEVENYFSKIGRPGKVIQVGGTAICRGKMISHPTSTYVFLGTTLLLGGIDDTTSYIFLQIDPDRIVPTILELFKILL